MQQILSRAGIPYMVISRLPEGFYEWRSPDGSSVLAYSPGHYTNASAILSSPPEKGAVLLTKNWPPGVLLFQARDPSGIPPPPLRGLLPADRLWPADPDMEQPSFRKERASAVPDALFAGRPFLRFLAGAKPDLDPVSRASRAVALYSWPDASLGDQRAERSGEAAACGEISRRSPASWIKTWPLTLRRHVRGWKAAIYPDHGWGGKEGQITDRLFRKKYEFARDKGKALLEGALAKSRAGWKRPSPKGYPSSSSTTLPGRAPDRWSSRSPPSAGRQVHDARGRRMPSQVLPPLSRREDHRSASNSSPPTCGLGYKTFYLSESEAKLPISLPSPAADVYENDFYKIEFAPAVFAGSMTRSSRPTSSTPASFSGSRSSPCNPWETGRGIRPGPAADDGRI